MRTLPPKVVQALAPFAPLFSKRVWRNAQVLLMGAFPQPQVCEQSALPCARGAWTNTNASIANPITFISRLRLDAALYEPAPPRRPHQVGRPRLKGERLPNLSVVAQNPAAVLMSWLAFHYSTNPSAQPRGSLSKKIVGYLLLIKDNEG